jgi:hypothetical protein
MEQCAGDTLFPVYVLIYISMSVEATSICTLTFRGCNRYGKTFITVSGYASDLTRQEET